MNGNDADVSQRTHPTTQRDHPLGYLPVKDPIGALVEDFAHVGKGKAIVLVVGEASPYVYNSAKFMDAARKAKRDHGARISVMTGPIMLVPDEPGEPNGLVQLLSDKVLTGLYHRPSRFALEHFRIVETCGTPRLYQEHSHPPLQDIRERSCVNFFDLPPAEIRTRANDAKRSFKFWKEQSTPHKLRSEHPGVLFATGSVLQALVQQAEEEDLAFNYLDAEELLALAQRCGQAFESPASRPPRQLEVPIAQSR